MQPKQNRSGFSLIELEVAFIIFMIAMSGLCPLVVMQSKHLKKIDSRLQHSSVYYIAPSSDEWARKLGACASIKTTDPGVTSVVPIMLIDDADTGFSTVGSDWVDTESTDSYQGAFHEVEPGDGTQIGRWSFSGLKPGWYEVMATWLPDDAFAADAPFKIYDGSDEVGSIQINQQIEPSGAEYSGKPWESLGTFQITGTDLAVEVNNSSGDKVLADAVRLVRVENDVRITSVEKSINSEEVTIHVSVTVQVPE